MDNSFEERYVEVHLAGDSALFVEELYESYRQDPRKVGRDWAGFFNSMDSLPRRQESSMVRQSAPLSSAGLKGVADLYRKAGHLAALIDPLGRMKQRRESIDDALNRLRHEGIDFDAPLSFEGEPATLQTLVERWEKIYCSRVGAEFYYLYNDKERVWLARRFEELMSTEPFSSEKREAFYRLLCEASFFERFLGKKYLGKKRFSLEGSESLVVLLEEILENFAGSGGEGVAMGMAHRGRLNVLANILHKPLELIFAEFEENYDSGREEYNDVKYHLGFSNMRKFPGGELKLSLLFNPSHLEAINPVLGGTVRARQDINQDAARRRFMGVLVHGDAAFAGQGVVAETLNLANIPGFCTGGNIHIVVNNQIGFTAAPQESRSTLYATDLAKGFEIPVFHVNGDDPDAVARVARLAVEYRYNFGKDFIIDLVSYRRWGHNEMDEPEFTQPGFYRAIREHRAPFEIYGEKLLTLGLLDLPGYDEIIGDVKRRLQDALNISIRENIKMEADSLHGRWGEFRKEWPVGNRVAQEGETPESLIEIGTALLDVPKGFTPHPKITRLLEYRREMLRGNLPVDWGFAESLALETVLSKGVGVRFCGQDAGRGTFSHRHAVWTDESNDSNYLPLGRPLHPSSGARGRFEMINSPLSEFAVLGYEFGYALTDPYTMCIWEAQFGDFVNGAQVVIDQYIAASESKWRRYSGIVLLLPHGYEGQGAEHSSARIERFLQLCAGENLRVLYPTTSGQYYHLLRRQAFDGHKKPLVVFSPKSLLRLPEAGVPLLELSGSRFETVLDDPHFLGGSTGAEPGRREQVCRLLICSGRLFYTLQKEREKNGAFDTAILRLEQLYPFPAQKLQEIFKRYPPRCRLVWVQEEPENMGARDYVFRRFQENFAIELEMISRPPGATPATGFYRLHELEEKEILSGVFGNPEVSA